MQQNDWKYSEMKWVNTFWHYISSHQFPKAAISWLFWESWYPILINCILNKAISSYVLTAETDIGALKLPDMLNINQSKHYQYVFHRT